MPGKSDNGHCKKKVIHMMKPFYIQNHTITQTLESVQYSTEMNLNDIHVKIGAID